MKKRILSLILALSMVLSVLPLGAFAEGSTGEPVIGSDGYPVGTSGTGWSYDNNTKTLTLTEGTFDFSSTVPVQCAIKLGQSAAIAGGTFNGAVTNDNHGNINNGTFNGTVINANGGLIFGGNFNGDVTNSATIINGTFKNEKKVINNAGGEIGGGNFNGNVENNTNGTIYNGKFTGTVTNSGTIKDGTFAGEVTNNDTINNGTFNGEVTNHGNIKDGTFEGTVKNYSGGTISGGTFAGSVQNMWDISGGTFQSTGSVENNGNIEKGTFEGTVSNSSIIKDGVFMGVVTNIGNGTISGGTFAGGVNNSYGGHIFGGVFNGYIDVDVPGVGVYPIAVDGASPGDKIEKVNGVSAVWDPYVVVMEGNALPEVTITANTKIYSLNHKPLSTDNCNSAHDGNENTVKFTMPNANVVLNGAITSTDLVMEKGWPKDSNGGKTPCKGDGWEYIPNDPTNGDMLLLTGSNQTGGLFDFSTIGDGAAVECNVFVGRPTAITGGEFNGKVFNNSGILGGTFHGEVDNRAPGIIKGGTFNGAVENNGTIEKGTFKNMCSVTNNAGGTISDGTFAGSVTNSGTVTGGVFNGNATLINVTGGHNITWDAASS